MSSVNFKFDKSALERVAQEAMQKAARDMQSVLDGVARRCNGQPVDDVLRSLRSAAHGAGWKATDADLRPYDDAPPVLTAL